MKDKKFSLPETVFALLITMSLDGLEAILGPIGLGFITTFLDLAAGFFIGFWIWLKGGRSVRVMRRLIVWVTSNGIELIPVVETLPWRTAAMIAVIKMFNGEKEDEGEDELSKKRREKRRGGKESQNSLPLAA